MQNRLARITRDSIFHALRPYETSVTGLFDKLDIKHSEDEIFASHDEINKLISLVKKESGIKNLPLVLGWNYPTAKGGDMLIAMMTASSVYDALNVLRNYYETFSLFGENVYIDSGETLRINIRFPWAMIDNMNLQMMATARLQRLLYDLFGPSFIPVKQGNFHFNEQIAEFFNLKPSVVKSEIAVVFHYCTSCFAIPLNNADASSHKHHLEKLKRRRTNFSITDSDDPVRATDKLFEVLSVKSWSKDNFAKELGMTTRAFDRHLNKYSTSFQSLFKRHAKRYAMNNLIIGKSVQNVAEDMGYSEAKSFVRAFKSWSDITPASYRELASKLNLERLKRNIIKTEKNPIFSTTTERIVQYSRSDERTPEDLVSILISEPVILCKILSYYTSTFNTTVDVSNLSEAINDCLALDCVFDFSMYLLMSARTSNHKYHTVLPVDIWMQSKLTFEFTSLLMRSFDAKEVNWELIHISTLYKDVGLIHLFDDNPKSVQTPFINRVLKDSTFSEFNEVVEDAIGISHYGLCKLILLRWGCGPDIVNFIDKLDSNFKDEKTDINIEIVLLAESFALAVRSHDLATLKNTIAIAELMFNANDIKGAIDISEIDKIYAKVRSESDLLFTSGYSD